MSKSSKSSANKKPAVNAKDLQLKVDELTEALENVRNENERLRTKLSAICKKIVDNVDMTQYEFIDPNMEPDYIETNDLLHMIQKLALLAAQINTTEKIESHMEALERRITELVSENSSFFKNKLKLQERLEFIMQERDIWKRNAETLKKMYAKLVKEQQQQQASSTSGRLSASSNHTVSKFVVGTYRANINTNNPNQRTFTASIPKDYFDQLRSSQITDIQLNQIDQRINSQLATLSSQRSQVEASTNQNHTNNDNSMINNINLFPHLAENSTNINSSEFAMNNRHVLMKKFDRSNTNSSDLDSEHINSNEQFDDLDSANIEMIEKPSMSRKNVSFNKDIDVRIFRKNSKNLKALENYMQPLAINQFDDKFFNENLNKLQTTIVNDTSNSVELKNHIKNNLLLRRTSVNTDTNSTYSNYSDKPLDSMNTNDSTSNYENRFTNRASICSKKKYPGETPVKDLEPTLKMVIIKELSIEKVDGNDWRMFAKRIGISENEIQNWCSLKLQYPMARVLSFWSSRPEATARILHRLLSSSCFNYSALAKRIENFYDVI